MMGGQSTSSSSASNSTSTENFDQKVMVESGGFGVGSDATVDLTLTDFGAVKGAGEILKDGLGMVSGVIKTVTDTFGQALSQNTSVMREAAEGDAKEVSSLMIKALGIVAVVVMVAVAFLRGK